MHSVCGIHCCGVLDLRKNKKEKQVKKKTFSGQDENPVFTSGHVLSLLALVKLGLVTLHHFFSVS